MGLSVRINGVKCEWYKSRKIPANTKNNNFLINRYEKSKVHFFLFSFLFYNYINLLAFLTIRKD